MSEAGICVNNGLEKEPETCAEMSDPEKNQISHRRRAIEALCGVLPEFLT